jgi:hypothetical protein
LRKPVAKSSSQRMRSQAVGAFTSQNRVGMSLRFGVMFEHLFQL